MRARHSALSAILGLTSVVALGCGEPEPITFLVDVVSDFQPGDAFDHVQTALYIDGTAVPLAEIDHAVTSSEPFARGVRVAEFNNQSAGTYRVEVVLMLGRTEIARARERFMTRSTRGVTVTFSRPEMDASIPDAGVDAGTDAGPFDAGMLVLFPPRDFVCVEGPEPCPTTRPLLSEAERTVAVTRDFPPTTFTYIISVLQMPEAAGGSAMGFNLDGFDSGLGSTDPVASCERSNQDYSSGLDPSHVGVDSTLQEMIPLFESAVAATDCPGTSTEGCFNRLLQRGVEDGAGLLLIEVREVESFTHDEAVEVTLHRAALPTGETLRLAGDEGLAPGQTFLSQEVLLTSSTADIFRGRLRVRWTGHLPIVLPLFDVGTTNFSDPELRGQLTRDRITLGVIGGATEVESLVSRVAATMPEVADTVRTILESASDLHPLADDPHVCNDVSAGFTFEAVSAEIAPP